MFMFETVYSNMCLRCIFFVSVSFNICELVTEMASSKYKVSMRKKLNKELGFVISSLRKENVYLKKTLVELSRQHSEHYKLVEVNLITLHSTYIILCFKNYVMMITLVRVVCNVCFTEN